MLEKKRRQELLDGSNRSQCYSGAREDCYSGPDKTAGRGACHMGKRSCTDGAWGECGGQVVPTPDLCNEIDDDCDGIVDNGFEHHGALCFYQGAKGACQTQGHWRCSADGKSNSCDAQIVKPQTETCNMIDDDCDGEVDEDSVPSDAATCKIGKAGVCNPGTNRCVNGKIRCIQNVQPGPEICNGLDDNCNNEVDEDCVSAEDAANQTR